ncbi:MAG: PEGA domain-containing protein [Paludibacter sp.]
MKKYISLLLLLSIFCSLSAQQIAVKSFRKLETDLDARLSETALKDFNGEQSAIIKIVTIQKGFTFDCGQIGIVKTINKASEIWVYVPHGAKRISIFHEKLGQIRDWMFTEPIEKASVYEMVLTTGKVITTVEETIDSQWLVITPEPADASVYLNDLFVKSGTYQAKLKPGSYSYRVEAPLYHTEAGKVEITDTKKEIIAKLKPAFGFVTVNTEPESDARVIIDGKTLMNNTPCKSDALASGTHLVQVIKEMFQPSAQKVIITDGQTTALNFKLEPNFAEISITAPTDATLYLNNDKRAIGSWTGRLNPGVYSLEARLDKHRPAKQDIELAAGDVKTVNLQPTPIYGTLDIITTPVGANITINGKDYGTTPNTIRKLLIGEYKVLLTKSGYASISKTVTISDGMNTEFAETLSTGKFVTINSTPSGANLYIDGKFLGITPYNGTIVLGKHNFRVEKANRIVEETIKISQDNGNLNFKINADSLSIGQFYQGGVIAYIFQPEDYYYRKGEIHGIISALKDKSNGVAFANKYIFHNATNITLGQGDINTNALCD